MVLPLDDVYPKIGASLLVEIGNDFKVASVIFRFQGESSFSVDGSYVDEKGTNQIFTVPNSVIQIFYEIYSKMSLGPEGKWKVMMFHLKPDGQFMVEFSY
jgi:hypothetical protein